MERYYRILGIPDNSSNEVIKKAYHAKMKALHPDKIHGTPLEDTATFFAAEINDAYNNLMSQSNENKNSSSQENQSSYIEKEIYIESIGFLRYTLSNNINTIISEVCNRTKRVFPDSASEIPWSVNPALSQNVKNAMNAHNMKYSMTSYWEGSVGRVIINKKSNDGWYISLYEINPRQKNTSANYRKSYTKNRSYSRYINQFMKLLKIIIVVLIFGVIFNGFNNQKSPGSQTQTGNTRTARTFATVASCNWVNVRGTPSSANNNNIIEALRVNTRVEIAERASNGWVKIRYGNGKTGYVHSSFLSR